MAFASSPDSPISKLDRDLLWNIFCINSWYTFPDGNDYSAGIGSPLTTTRKSSQVCALWREIILASPSIWGNCIDLDSLGKAGREWCEEVLQRTASAPLSVWSYRKIRPDTTRHALLMSLIQHHWARIQMFNVHVESTQILYDARVWSAFSRPAQHLRIFSLRSDEEPTDSNEQSGPPADFRLFSDDAPVLTQFSLFADDEILLPLATRPFPSLFFTTQLRRLDLNQPTELSIGDLLTVCEQMPYLEELAVTISELLPDDTRHIPSPHRHVTLPRLRRIEVSTPSLDIYSGFLGRITTGPGCAFRFNIRLDPIEGQTTETLMEKVKEMQRVLAHYANDFFDHHRDGPNSTTEVGLTMLENVHEVTEFTVAHTTHNNQSNYFLTPAFDDDGIPDVDILDAVINTMSALKFPNTIVRLRLFFTNSLREDNPFLSSLLEFFLALGSVSELMIDRPGSLQPLVEILESQTYILFPSLKVVYLGGIGFFNSNSNRLVKRFLTHRKRTVPLETLDLTDCCQSGPPQGDLRYLDGFTGLRVIWRRGEVPAEYICGSGNRDVLLMKR